MDFSLSTYTPFAEARFLGQKISETFGTPSRSMKETAEKIIKIAVLAMVALAALLIEAVIALPVMALRICFPTLEQPVLARPPARVNPPLSQPNSPQAVEESFEIEPFYDEVLKMGLSEADSSLILTAVDTALKKIEPDKRAGYQKKLHPPIQDVKGCFKWVSECTIAHFLKTGEAPSFVSHPPDRYKAKTPAQLAEGYNKLAPEEQEKVLMKLVDSTAAYSHMSKEATALLRDLGRLSFHIQFKTQQTLRSHER